MITKDTLSMRHVISLDILALILISILILQGALHYDNTSRIKGVVKKHLASEWTVAIQHVQLNQ